MRGVIAALFAALALSPAAYAAPLPRLQVAESPFVVRGTGFQPRERVTLTLTAGRKFVRTIVTTSHGTFAVRFFRATSDECNGYAARAVGSRGSRASIRVTRSCTPGDASSP